MSNINDIYKVLGTDEKDWPELNKGFINVLGSNFRADLVSALNPNQLKELDNLLKESSQPLDALGNWLQQSGSKIDGLNGKLENSVVKSMSDFFNALAFDADDEKRQKVAELIKQIEI